MRNQRFNKKPVSKNSFIDDDLRIMGIHAVKASLLHKPERAVKLHIQEGSTRLEELTTLAKQMGVVVEKYNNKNFVEKFGGEVVHQGVVLLVKPFEYVNLDTFLQEQKIDLCLVLDGVEDPRNLGRAARSAFALGAQLLIIPKDRSAQITATVEKAAVGCLASLPVAQVNNLSRALETLKEAGLWIVGAAGETKISVWEFDFKRPTALVVGNEEKGLRPLIKEKCDQLLKIPMADLSLSLNAADAATCFMYEIVRQRLAK